MMNVFSKLFGNKPETRRTVRISGVNARYDAAQSTKDNVRHWGEADYLSADASNDPGVRQTLRSRTRYEVANNSYAKGLVSMLANDTIGTGPRLQMLSTNGKLNTRIERDFLAWSNAIRLPEKLRLMRKARCQDGETFAMLVSNPKVKGFVKLDVQPIEADRINDTVFDLNGTDVDGIKFDKYGNPERYHVSKFHPGDSRFSYEGYFDVKAENMIHMFIEDRPGQHRGIPELTSALPLFAQLRRFNLATLSTAEAAADFAAILYTDAPPNGESEDVEPMDTVQLERNMMLTVPAGWKMEQLDPKHPTSNHSEFVKIILSEIARCVCCTYGLISGDYSGFNYASGRLDNQIYQKSVLVDRSAWETEVLNRIFDHWFREYSLATGVNAKYGERYKWFWDAFLHVDPTKEANAQETRLGDGMTTYAEEYARQGLDWEAQFQQMARERKLMKDLGITNAVTNTANETSNGDIEDEQ